MRSRLIFLLILVTFPLLNALSVSPGGFTLPEGVSEARLSLNVLVDPGTSVTITPMGSLADYVRLSPSRLTTPGWHTVSITITLPPTIPRDLKFIVTSTPTQQGMLTARAGIIIPVSQGIRILLQESLITPTILIFTQSSLPIHLIIQDENATTRYQTTFTGQPEAGKIIIPLNYSILPYAPYTVLLRAGSVEKTFKVVLGTPRVERHVTWKDSCLAILTLTNPTPQPIYVKLLQPSRQDLGLLQPAGSIRVPLRTCHETTLRVWLNGRTISTTLTPPEPSPRRGWLLALLIIAAILMIVAMI